MKEANDPKYFIDGFLIKHFDIWPAGVNKNDLFETQKIFLVYLMGAIPELRDWKTQVRYETEMQEIIDEKKIDLTDADVDIAKLHNKNISDVRKEKLKIRKKELINDLKKRYGLKIDQEEIKIPEGLPKGKSEKSQQATLWEMIEGQGLVKK